MRKLPELDNCRTGKGTFARAVAAVASDVNSMFVLLLTAMVMLVLASSMVTHTFAWHVTSREAGSADGQVYSDSTEASVTPYSLYTCSSDGSTVTVYSSEDKVSLNSYDAILGRNDYTSVYIRMPVYGVVPGDTIKFTVTANGTLNDVNGNSSGVDGSGRNILLNQYLSNIISVSCANIPESSIPADASRDTIYHNALGWFSSHSVDKGTFVNYSPGARPRDPVVLNSKSPTMYITLEDGDYTIESDGYVYVYFKIDYEYPLVDAYITALRLQMGGFKIGEAGHSEFSGTVDGIGFDLESIVMSIEKPI